MDPLDPDRIATIKYIYDLTKRTIAVGDTVRLGIEGDPCCKYRSADDSAARTGTVMDVVRNKDDEAVNIVAQIDGEKRTLAFTNVGLSGQDEAWEAVDPGSGTLAQGRTAGEVRDNESYAPVAATSPRDDAYDAQNSPIPPSGVKDLLTVPADVPDRFAPVALVDNSTEDNRKRVDLLDDSVKRELQTLADELALTRKENKDLVAKLDAIEMNSMNSDAFMKQMCAFQESITASQTALARDIVNLHRRETPTNAYLITNYVDGDDTTQRFGSTKHEPELAVGRETVQDIRRWGEDDSTRRFGAGVEYSAEVDTSEADVDNP